MKDIKDIQKEANTLEIDLTCVVSKTRDGSSLFQKFAENYEKSKYDNSGSKHHKKTLAECKNDFVRKHNESDWEDLTSQVCPVNVTSHSTATAEYFNELDRQWDKIRRTPALDVSDRYSAPVVLSSILRPFLSQGGQFNFSMSPEQPLPFDLGPSYAPLPPLSDEEQQKRLKKLITRLERLHKGRTSCTSAIVTLSMLQSYVKQMKENDAVIQSFENISYSSPNEPTAPISESKGEPFSGRKAISLKVSNVAKSALFSVKQIRDEFGKIDHDVGEKQRAQLIEWDAADEESVQLTIFSLPSRTKPRKSKELSIKEYDFWFAVLLDQNTIDNMNGDLRQKLIKKLQSWPKKKFINRRNVLEGFWNKCMESMNAWDQLLIASSTENWQPKYPAIPKHIYAARILSDKMLVYANSLRDEVEDFITPLLQTAATAGGDEKDNPFSYYSNKDAPTAEWDSYPGGVQSNPIFSYALKSDTQQAAAATNVFRRRQVVSLHASLYEKDPASGTGVATSQLASLRSGASEQDNVDGKSVRGRRRWSVGLGEKEIVDNVGGNPVAGVPAALTGETIPVQSAIQWAFNQSANKFFFLKTDIVKLSCDFKKLTALLTCERNGEVNSLSFTLKDCFRVSPSETDTASSAILELNLLDLESYHVVEELKNSKLQLHTALKYNRPEADILSILTINPSCVAEKDFDGKLPLIVAIEKDESSTVIGSLLARSLPMDLSGNFQEFPGGSYCWIYVLTQTNDKYVDAVVHVLNTFVKDMNHIIKISALTDEFGRKALDVATPKCRRAILSTMYFLGRYELKDGPPEHKSATCLVHLAIDRDNGDMPVALKLMRWRSQYKRELQSRAECSFESEYVVGIVRDHDGDKDASFIEELSRKGYGWYRYCIVMPAAERNLAGVMAHEHIAGKDWKKIRQATEELCECIVHVQSKGMIHGDIKPLNIVRESGRIKLLDLDACVSYKNEDFCGAKYSSAYLPPEMVHCNLVELTAVVKSFIIDEDTGNIVKNESEDFSLVKASPSMDAWALGVTSFELCTGEPFFLNNDEDNIDEQNLFALGTFSSRLKQEKMKKILNPQARNFVSLLMNVDAEKRLTIPRALQHPFITGRDAARMPGDQAEFDVFISYRVASDAHHAARIYEMLTGRGLKVWWDKVCLEAGVPWDEGFCHGLIKSHAFVPLLSRHAINHPEINHQNFEKLTSESRCDNVYLEYRLALELREMGLVEKIFPVMIGDFTPAEVEEVSATTEGGDEKKQETVPSGGVYTHYFSSGCHPSKPSTAVVATVETALRGHLEKEGLGSPYTISETPQSVLSQITQNQGGFVTGSMDDAFTAIIDTVVDMIHCSDEEEDAALVLQLSNSKQQLAKQGAGDITSSSSTAGVGGAVAALKARIESLTEENLRLKLERERKHKIEKSAEEERIAATIKELQEENKRLKLAQPSSNSAGSGYSPRGGNAMPSSFAEELSKFDQGIEISCTTPTK